MTSEDLLPRLQAAGLIDGTEIRVTALTGGVSSDIVLVESGARRFVVKAALEKLRVKDDWFVDVSRNRVEQSFFEYVSPLLPAAVPRILGGGDGWFAMEYLGGELQNWKSLLLAGHFEAETARLAGEVLGRMHAVSWNDPVACERFDTLPNFQALRIDPYLLTTAERAPEAAEFLRAEAVRLAATKLALVHGDYSPKNLLVGPNRLIVLDAECAWFGDPAFDAAFLLTHLHLKALLNPRALELVPMFWSAYSSACGHDLEKNTVKLLLCLLLARVHGKSPAEDLSPAQGELVTRFVLSHISQPLSLAALTEAWPVNS